MWRTHSTNHFFLLAALQTVGETDSICVTGVFDGVGHVTALLDYSMDRAVRCCLLRLLESLLAPEASGQDEKAGRVAAANGRAFVEAGGVQLAVDLVAGSISHHTCCGSLLVLLLAAILLPAAVSIFCQCLTLRLALLL